MFQPTDNSLVFSTWLELIALEFLPSTYSIFRFVVFVLLFQLSLLSGQQLIPLISQFAFICFFVELLLALGFFLSASLLINLLLQFLLVLEQSLLFFKVRLLLVAVGDLAVSGTARDSLLRSVAIVILL